MNVWLVRLPKVLQSRMISWVKCSSWKLKLLRNILCLHIYFSKISLYFREHDAQNITVNAASFFSSWGMAPTSHFLVIWQNSQDKSNVSPERNRLISFNYFYMVIHQFSFDNLWMYVPNSSLFHDRLTIESKNFVDGVSNTGRSRKMPWLWHSSFLDCPCVTLLHLQN